MSAEELIRDKHRVENAVHALRIQLQVWQRRFDLQTNQELELSVAKLLDLSAANPDDRQLKLKRGCPEFCVNGASVKSWASSLQTGW